MKEYFESEIAPVARKLGHLLATTSYMPVHIPVIDQSSTQTVYVRQFCNHEPIGGECVKCRIVIEEFDPREDDE